MTILSVSTLSALVLGLGGAIHLGWLSSKRGWYVIAAGILLILARRLFYFPDPYDAVNSIHSVIMLVGITMLFRSYTGEVDSLRTLADSIPNLVWMADAKGNVTYINQRFADYAGIELAVAAAFRTGHILHPNEREQVVKLWSSCVKHIIPFESEHRIRSALGEYRWFLCRATPLCHKGRPTQWYGTAFDIHETKLRLENLQAK